AGFLSARPQRTIHPSLQVLTVNHIPRERAGPEQDLTSDDTGASAAAPATHLLLVEDDRELATVLCEGLQENGIRVTHALRVSEGRALALERNADIIVLDVMLPGGSGFDLCRELRRASVSVPILMLTARDAVDDRVTGLDAGADDYLVKPFAFRELLARIRALVRRGRGSERQARLVRIADLEVDLASHRVARGGREIELTAKEFALLEFFVRHPGDVVDRAAITAFVWDENHDPFTNVLEVLIRRLRRKIDDEFEPRLIRTLRGAGYRFGL
ncbi:MAG: response regulator transcription factor, partial [Gemmatimonadaceae bacterium]